METGAGAGGPGPVSRAGADDLAYTRDENAAARLDRHWQELLQELRVAQTGVQILFAFLLVVAFSARFQDAGPFAHAVFAVTLVMTALATGLLIAPVSVHRLVFRRRLRLQLVQLTARMAVGGLFLMLLAIAGALLLALDVVLPRGGAVAIAAAVVAWLALFWYVIPIALRRRAARVPQSDMRVSSRGEASD